MNMLEMMNKITKLSENIQSKTNSLPYIKLLKKEHYVPKHVQKQNS